MCGQRADGAGSKLSAQSITSVTSLSGDLALPVCLCVCVGGGGRGDMVIPSLSCRYKLNGV